MGLFSRLLWSTLLVYATCWCLLAVLSSAAVINVPADGSDLTSVVANQATDGDTIQLENGVYTFTAEIVLNKNISIVGQSRGGTIIDCGHSKRFASVNQHSFTLRSVTVRNCQANPGGAMQIDTADVVFNDVEFFNNTAPGVFFNGQAGCILILGNSNVSATNSVWRQNTGGVAGAIWINDGIASFTNVEFSDNLVFGGGFGGAIVPEGISVSTYDNCRFINNTALSGGAVDDGTTSTQTYRNCYFAKNTAHDGGAYYSFARSSATFISCTFENNRALTGGGAAQITSSSTPKFIDCTFRNNAGDEGAAINILGGAFTTISKCKFEDSQETSSSGGYLYIDGAVSIKDSTFRGGNALEGGAISLVLPTNVTIDGCSFTKNQAVSVGGGIYAEGFLADNAVTNVKIVNCEFDSNSAPSGAAYYATGTNSLIITFEKCKFRKNKATSYGGVGYSLLNVTTNIVNCKVSDNSAGSSGGAFAAFENSHYNIRNSKFNSNDARFGGSLYQTDAGYFIVKKTTFHDSSAIFDGGVFFASISTGCSYFEDVKFNDNHAQVAGGALYFTTKPYCRKFCDDCHFSNNSALYGEDYATGPYRIKPTVSLKKRLRPSELFRVRFDYLDYFNQTVLGFIDSKTILVLDGALNSTAQKMRGTLSKQPAKNGSVLFDDLRFTAKPNQNIRVLWKTQPPTTEVKYTVHIENCNSDEILYKRGNKYYCLEIQDPIGIIIGLAYGGIAIVLFFSFAFLILLFWKREEKPIKNASPIFCYLIIVGIILATVSIAMWTKATDGMCVLRPWLLTTGTTLIFGSLFVREWRLLMIFKNSSNTRSVLSNLDLIKGLVLFLSINFVILIVWTAVDAPTVTSSISIKDKQSNKYEIDEITYECDVSVPSGIFAIIIIVYQCLLLAFDCIVSFVLRNLPSAYNESKFIAITIYNSAIMIAIGIVLVIVFETNKTAVLVIVAVTILFACTVALFSLFGIKVYLSLLSKEGREALIEKEIQQLYHEIWSKERQIQEIGKSHGTTSPGTNGVSNTSMDGSSLSKP